MKEMATLAVGSIVLSQTGALSDGYGMVADGLIAHSQFSAEEKVRCKPAEIK